MTGALELAMVEWEDSARPIPEWRFLGDAPDLEVVRCLSVGWVTAESDAVLMLAPNLGDSASEHPQASGFIRIPKRSIVRRVSLQEAP